MFNVSFFKKVIKTYATLNVLAVNVIATSAIAQLAVLATLPSLELREEPREERSNLVQFDCGLENSGEYKLGPGDRIRINNLEGIEYSGDHQIPPDGNISLPIIGSVSIGGLTLEEATNLIVSRYRQFFKYPLINIYIQSIGPIEVVVAGEVSSPGIYVISREDQSQHRGIELPTVIDAIKMAGGITLSGDPSQVVIRRKQRSGAEQIIAQDLWDFVRVGDRCDNITLQNGDTVYVPLNTSVDFSEIRQLATATFGADIEEPRTIAVLGEVTRPGSYVVQGGDTQLDRRSDGLPTITRAIQLAGGLRNSASIENIEVRRTTKTGEELTFEVNLQQFLRQGDVSQDIVLQEGDTILVPTSQTTDLSEIRQLTNTNLASELAEPRRVVVIGEVQRPGPYIIKVRDPFVKAQAEGLPTVTRALQLAGGIKPSANLRAVEVRRPRKDGEQILYLDLWKLLETGDINQDLILEEGDTVFIPKATEVTSSEVIELATASFAPDKITVYVVGEAIGSPNIPPRPEVELPVNTSLNQAILSSGAIYWGRIGLETAELIRLNVDGTVARRRIKLNLDAGINEQTNPILRNKDIIVVRTTRRVRLADSLQKIGNSMLFIPRIESLLRVLGFLGVIENKLNED